MADLEERIGQWRRELAESLGGSAEVLEELEGHLRDEIRRLVLAGRPMEQAFVDAVGRLGSPQALASEFARVTPTTSWLPIRVAVVALIALAGWLVGMLFTSDRLHGQLGLLLATHITAVTLGYTTTLIVGALAACYLLARPFGVPDPRQLQSLVRATHFLTAAALALTALGVVLGGFWARESWGRFWGWDARETSAALVLLWDAAMLVVLTRRLLGPRATLLLGLAGNVVVALAWFAPSLVRVDLRAHHYPPLVGVLAVFVLAQAVLACLGLVPPGCASKRKVIQALGKD
jgi:Cytochrome C assembly protein